MINEIIDSLQAENKELKEKLRIACDTLSFIADTDGFKISMNMEAEFRLKTKIHMAKKVLENLR